MSASGWNASVEVRVPEVVEIPAHGGREDPRALVLVERVDLGIRVAAPGALERPQQRRLAGARRAHDQRVANIADIE